MAATAGKKGSDMLLKFDTNGSLNFVTVAGIKTKSLKISADTVDITNQDSASKMRELLAGAGIIKMSVSGAGVFTTSTALAAVRAAILAGTIRAWQVIVPGEGTYQGLFQITGLEYAGQHDGEVTYDISLDSAGEITFA